MRHPVNEFATLAEKCGYTRRMDVTENTRTLIQKAIRAKGLTQTALAREMGHGKAWATRLLNGKLKRLSDSDVERLEAYLGIQFFVVTPTARVSGVAVELSKTAETDEVLAAVLAGLLELTKAKAGPGHRGAGTRDLASLGQEIARLASEHRDEPERLAQAVLELLAEGAA